MKKVLILFLMLLCGSMLSIAQNISHTKKGNNDQKVNFSKSDKKISRANPSLNTKTKTSNNNSLSNSIKKKNLNREAKLSRPHELHHTKR